jgi:origin recognition complex subunit 6
MDTSALLGRLGISNPRLTSKSNELLRLSFVRLPAGGLGQGELCRAVCCLDLAATTLQTCLDVAQLRRIVTVSEKTYRNSKTTLQKVLKLGVRTSARDLCIQSGCAGIERQVKAALDTYKAAFIESLPQGYSQSIVVDFSRPVFLAAAFYATARKHKVSVDRRRLLEPLGIYPKEFSDTIQSMTRLCPDLFPAPPSNNMTATIKSQKRKSITENDDNDGSRPGGGQKTNDASGSGRAGIGEDDKQKDKPNASKLTEQLLRQTVLGQAVDNPVIVEEEEKHRKEERMNSGGSAEKKKKQRKSPAAMKTKEMKTTLKSSMKKKIKVVAVNNSNNYDTRERLSDGGMVFTRSHSKSRENTHLNHRRNTPQ